MGLAIWIAAALACSAAQAGAAAATACPPASYPLKDLEIRLADGNPRGTSKIELRGSGEGRGSRFSRTVLLDEYSFTMSPQELVDLLNLFLQSYFFDRPDSYTEPVTAHLQEDGTVNSEFISNSDGGATTLTLKLGRCEKSCTFRSGRPSDLEDLARRVRKLAEVRTPKP